MSALGRPFHPAPPCSLDFAKVAICAQPTLVRSAVWGLGGSEDLSLGAGAALKCWPVRRFGVLDDGPELIEAAE